MTNHVDFNQTERQIIAEKTLDFINKIYGGAITEKTVFESFKIAVMELHNRPQSACPIYMFKAFGLKLNKTSRGPIPVLTLPTQKRVEWRPVDMTLKQPSPPLQEKIGSAFKDKKEDSSIKAEVLKVISSLINQNEMLLKQNESLIHANNSAMENLLRSF
ncbi:MAG TPA: hypothetical protein VFM18_08400 [Methanosarcina sp.]|nr:hypothetical protein [Methanosarcina sp.]